MLDKHKKDNSKIVFLQQNADRNLDLMNTCLEFAFEKHVDYILFQEPWMSPDNMWSATHSAYFCILPENKELRSRVAIYARKSSRFQSCLRSDLCSSNDLMIMDIKD